MSTSELGRTISAPLVIEYDPIDVDEKNFRLEFDTLAQTDEDPIGQWLKIAKAKGETRESDSVLLHLVVELHRKVDDLTKLINNERPTYVQLHHVIPIESVGHGHFFIEQNTLDRDKEYYGRVNLPVFPQRVVPVYFTALDANHARVTIMHERDIKDWDSYILARERQLIREQKGLN